MYSTGPLQAGNRVNNHLRNAGIHILIIQVTEKIEQCMLRAHCRGQFGGQCVQHNQCSAYMHADGKKENAPGEVRTLDLQIMRLTLFRLSYRSILFVGVRG